jgi:hypothetical protein
MGNIKWSSFAIGVAVAWFGVPLLKTLIAKAQSKV